jgi:hypothetical protein
MSLPESQAKGALVMEPIKVTIFPPTLTSQPDRFRGTPGKNVLWVMLAS